MLTFVVSKHYKPMRGNLIDFVRCWLIVGMTLIHIVHFNDVYPVVKPIVYALTMPPFLLICGLLFNASHEPRHFFKNWGQWTGLYCIMELCYAVASYFLPVRDGLAELSVASVAQAVLVQPIGVYWFLHTMLLCQLIHYVCYLVAGKRMLPAIILTTIIIIILVQFTPLLWNISYYFVAGIILRYGGALVWAARCSGQWLDNKAIQYIGRNTLPIYIFHPLFTMASRYYEPLFAWDSTAMFFTLFTVILCVGGSLIIAWGLDKSRMCLLLCRPHLLR